MAKQFYKAAKEGWDGRKIRVPGEIFAFAGKKGSWMIPCDEEGNLLEGAAMPENPRDVRPVPTTGGAVRSELKEQLNAAGIPFPRNATDEKLAELLEGKEKVDTAKGTGNQEVI